MSISTANSSHPDPILTNGRGKVEYDRDGEHIMLACKFDKRLPIFRFDELRR